jgi:CheY-like chemotaxis protein
MASSNKQVARKQTTCPLPPPNGADSDRSRPLASRTIVIADDDLDLVNSITQRCIQLGCRVFGASSALEAINAIHRVMPDLVCIDVNMPAGNGLGVYEMMAGDERLRSLAGPPHRYSIRAGRRVRPSPPRSTLGKRPSHRQTPDVNAL